MKQELMNPPRLHRLITLVFSNLKRNPSSSSDSLFLSSDWLSHRFFLKNLNDSFY
ncbi:hypothetical protein [Ectobacillus ponti]|uniref:Uncharacterized protein n=1 Tax=Ectobacillus ponti TaxID=2961894 RepID=A0AA41XC28_9BACI|nr:hypothetical protein [Ectobacillus ponti]MCP8969286.1 hypothetical protein [Ectobacillus ponti]